LGRLRATSSTRFSCFGASRLFSLAELADGCELRGEGRQLGFDGRDFLLVLRLARASSARFRASVALASSRSWPRIAVSASTVTTSGCTSRIPPATKTSSSSPPPAGLILTDPGLMRVMSGAWRGQMPSSPASPGSTTNSASPE